jgi:hypothetical protein
VGKPLFCCHPTRHEFPVTCFSLSLSSLQGCESGSALGEMDHGAYGAVDTEGVANNFASCVQSISIGDNALDGDVHVMVMTLAFLVFGVVIFKN